MKTEIWTAHFERLLGAAEAMRGTSCVAATAEVVPGVYVVRTCHLADSDVPASTPSDPRHITYYHLTMYAP